jgi:hypothetical protein
MTDDEDMLVEETEIQSNTQFNTSARYTAVEWNEKK